MSSSALVQTLVGRVSHQNPPYLMFYPDVRHRGSWIQRTLHCYENWQNVHHTVSQKTQFEEIIHFAASNPDLRNPQERWWNAATKKIQDQAIPGVVQVCSPKLPPSCEITPQPFRPERSFLWAAIFVGSIQSDSPRHYHHCDEYPRFPIFPYRHLVGAFKPYPVHYAKSCNLSNSGSNLCYIPEALHQEKNSVMTNREDLTNKNNPYNPLRSNQQLAIWLQRCWSICKLAFRTLSTSLILS